MSKIEWTEKTWNPCHEDALEIPLKRKKPTTWFVNSMSDLFHKGVPFGFIDKVFAVMALCPQHTFQILTKRPERMREYLEDFLSRGDAVMRATDEFESRERAESVYFSTATGKKMVEVSFQWPLPNVWLGVSVENQATADERIPYLLRTPAAFKFISYEPALEEVDFTRFIQLTEENHGQDHFDREGWGYDEWSGGFCGVNPHGADSCYVPCCGIDQIIWGGESVGGRRCELDWGRSVIRQCRDTTAVFIKQLGSNAWDKGKRVHYGPKGQNFDEWPPELRVREMPEPVVLETKP